MDKQLKNSEPIYLGFEKARNRYYFYAIKDGVPRFLVYVTYFYWDRGPDTVLSFPPVPDNIEAELRYFLQDRVEYEFFKQRKNSKEQSVKKVFKTPLPLDPSLPTAVQSGNSNADGASSAPVPDGSGAAGSTVSEGTLSADAPKRRRRVSRSEPGSTAGITPEVPKPTPKKREQKPIGRKVADVEIDLEYTPTTVITSEEPKPRKSRVSKAMKVPEVTEPVEASGEQPKRGRRRSKEGTGKPDEAVPTTVDTADSGSKKGPVENATKRTRRSKGSVSN